MKTKFMLSTLLAFPALSHAQTNFIIILTDDQGYQDIGCYGSPLIETPNLDKMAEEGLRLTNFYVSASVSSASRAGLLTGQLNTRNGVKGVGWPDSKGLPTDKITIANALKTKGYATGCFGKWHLGDLEGYLPTDRGFDYYYGIPYSNDMYIGYTHKFSPNCVFTKGYNLDKALQDQQLVKRTKNKAQLKKELNYASPLFENKEVIEYPCDQATTTYRYFNKAMEFIGKNKHQPFFVYLTPSMPHVPLFVSPRFKGKSKRGLYGDAVEEIDWNVGRLLDFLEKEGLSENTMVIFTSDNGPWLGMKENGGSALPLRDGKFSAYEGGVRTPCIIKWKNHIPAGKVSDHIIASIDIFPTLLELAQMDKSKYDLDGITLTKFISNPDNVEPRDRYLYVKDGKIVGIRQNDWIYLPQTGRRVTPKENFEQELFNIRKDIGQKSNLFKKETRKAQEMEQLLQQQSH